MGQTHCTWSSITMIFPMVLTPFQAISRFDYTLTNVKPTRILQRGQWSTIQSSQFTTTGGLNVIKQHTIYMYVLTIPSIRHENLKAF